jgi:hypothetical protein
LKSASSLRKQHGLDSQLAAHENKELVIKIINNSVNAAKYSQKLKSNTES